MTTTTRKSLWDYTTVSGVFILIYHAALLIGLPLYFWYRTPSLGLVITSIVALFLTEIGIGAAYHRFYSHRAYEMKKPAEGVLLHPLSVLGLMALALNSLRWTRRNALQWAGRSYPDRRRRLRLLATEES